MKNIGEDEMPEIDFTKCRVIRRGPRRDRRVALATLRGSVQLTQSALAKRAGISQSEASRLEDRNDCLVSTMRKYVEALGGELQLVAEINGRKYPIALGGK